MVAADLRQLGTRIFNYACQCNEKWQEAASNAAFSSRSEGAYAGYHFVRFGVHSD
ncbi:hypothetical protein D3C80_2081470 [compost metagenome]